MRIGSKQHAGTRHTHAANARAEAGKQARTQKARMDNETRLTHRQSQRPPPHDTEAEASALIADKYHGFPITKAAASINGNTVAIRYTVDSCD